VLEQYWSQLRDLIFHRFTACDIDLWLYHFLGVALIHMGGCVRVAKVTTN